jgi:hypothetical protein
MKFTVVWTNDAIDELATIWINAGDRAAVTDASNEIDRQLARDPEHAGEQREGVVRLLIIEPLAVVFAVRSQDRIATVFSVYRVH